MINPPARYLAKVDQCHQLFYCPHGRSCDQFGAAAVYICISQILLLRPLAIKPLVARKCLLAKLDEGYGNGFFRSTTPRLSIVFPRKRHEPGY